MVSGVRKVSYCQHPPSARAPCAHGRQNLHHRSTGQLPSGSHEAVNTPDKYDLNKDWDASMAVDMDCCATFDIKMLLAVGGHVHVSRDTFLSDAHCSTRNLAGGLCCGVTATGLCDIGTLLVGSEAVIHNQNRPCHSSRAPARSMASCMWR